MKKKVLATLLASSIPPRRKIPIPIILINMFFIACTMISSSGFQPRNGTGSYITKPDEANLSDVIGRMIVIDNMDYKDIYDMRIILEVAACKKAASVITSDEIDELGQLLLSGCIFLRRSFRLSRRRGLTGGGSCSGRYGRRGYDSDKRILADDRFSVGGNSTIQ